MSLKRKTIFICGLPAAGKTTISKKLCDLLSEKGIVISQDWYIRYSTKKRRERLEEVRRTGDAESIRKEENPVNWYDYDLFAKDLKKLQKTGKLKIKNVWNQKTGKKDKNINITISDDAIIICEGIYLLHKDIARHADFIIYLRYPLKKSIIRQEDRDSHRNSKEYLAHKRYLVKEYTMPYLKHNLNSADITLDVNRDYDAIDNKIKKISKQIL